MLDASGIFNKIVDYKKSHFSNSQRYDLPPTIAYNAGIYPWGNLIDITAYYLDPRFIFCGYNPYRNYGAYDRPEMHIRTDTKASNIASNSCTAFSGMLLPKGVETFKVRWNKAHNILRTTDSAQTMDKLQDLELIANNTLWEKLREPELKLTLILNCMVKDYLNYGTAVAIKQENNWQHIPFLQSAIGVINGQLAVAYTENMVSFEQGIGQNQYKHRLYVYDGTKYVKYSCVSVNILPQGEEFKEDAKIDLGKMQVVVARMEENNQLYGIGCGMQVLSSMIDANMYNNCLRLNAQSVYYPAVALGLDFQTVNVQNSCTKYMSNQNENKDIPAQITMLPGTSIAITREIDITQTGQAPITILSNPGQNFEMFNVMHQKCVQEIEDKYFMSFIGKLTGLEGGGPTSATEVRAILQAASQQFKGVVEPFYFAVVYPMVKSYLENIVVALPITYQEIVANIRAVYPDFDIKDYEIETINIVKQHNEEQRLENFKMFLQTIMQLQIQDPDIAKKIKERLNDLLN